MAMGTGCVTVKEDVSFRDTPSTPEVVRARLPERAVFRVATTLEGTALRFRATRADTCRVEVTPIVHRVQMTRRSEGRGMGPAASFTMAALAAGTGVVGLAAAPQLAQQTGNPATAYQVTSAGLLAVGGLFLVGAVVDAIRLRDSETEVGDVRMPGTSREEACGEESVDGPYVVRFADGTNVRTTASADGWRASLEEVGADAFGEGSECHVSITAGGFDAEAQFHATFQHCELVRRALLASPKSRYAREYSVHMRDECKRAYDPDGRAPSSVAEATLGIEALQHAKVQCTAAWGTDAYAAVLDGAEKRRDRLELEAADAACAQAMTELERALKKKDFEAVDVSTATLLGAENDCQKTWQGERYAKLVARGQKWLVAEAIAEDRRRIALWGKHAARCATAVRDLATVDSMWSCDASCERIRAKIVAALSALESQLPPLPRNEEAARRVAAICLESECPACPEVTQ